MEDVKQKEKGSGAELEKTEYSLVPEKKPRRKGSNINFMTNQNAYPNFPLQNPYLQPMMNTAPYQIDTYAIHTKKDLVKQLEYYFCDDNLKNDAYLKQHMDSNGYVPIHVILAFKRIKNAHLSVSTIIQCANHSDNIQVIDNFVRNAKTWWKWISTPLAAEPEESLENSKPIAFPAEEFEIYRKKLLAIAPGSSKLSDEDLDQVIASYSPPPSPPAHRPYNFAAPSLNSPSAYPYMPYPQANLMYLSPPPQMLSVPLPQEYMVDGRYVYSAPEIFAPARVPQNFFANSLQRGRSNFNSMQRGRGSKRSFRRGGSRGQQRRNHGNRFTFSQPHRLSYESPSASKRMSGSSNNNNNNGSNNNNSENGSNTNNNDENRMNRATEAVFPESNREEMADSSAPQNVSELADKMEKMSVTTRNGINDKNDKNDDKKDQGDDDKSGKEGDGSAM